MKPFIKAHELRAIEQAEEINFSSWISGIYVSYSLASVLGEGNQYPQEPLLLFKNEEESEEKHAKDSELFGAYAAMFNKSFNKEKVKENNKE